MASGLTVVDSTVVVDILRGQPGAGEFARALESRMVASEVTRVEIMRGLRSAERSAAERLFRGLRWVPVDESIARRAGELGRRWRNTHRQISLSDLIVAATAQDLGAQLATSNVSHFPMFAGLMAPYAPAPAQ